MRGWELRPALVADLDPTARPGTVAGEAGPAWDARGAGVAGTQSDPVSPTLCPPGALAVGVGRRPRLAGASGPSSADRGGSLGAAGHHRDGCCTALPSISGSTFFFTVFQKQKHGSTPGLERVSQQLFPIQPKFPNL